MVRGLQSNPRVVLEKIGTRLLIQLTRDAVEEDSGFYTITLTAKDSNTHFGFLTKEIQVRIINRKKLIASIESFNINDITLGQGATQSITINVIGDSGKKLGSGKGDPSDFNWIIKKLPLRADSQYLSVNNNGQLIVKTATPIEANGQYEIIGKTKDSSGGTPSKFQGSMTNVFTLKMINLESIIFSNKVIATLQDGRDQIVNGIQKEVWTTNAVTFHEKIFPSLMVKTVGGEYKDVADLKGITFSMTPKVTDYYDGVDPHGLTMNNRGEILNNWTKKAAKIAYTVNAIGNEDENNFFGTISTEISFASAYVPEIPNGITIETGIDGVAGTAGSIDLNDGFGLSTGGGERDFHSSLVRNINPRPNDISYVSFSDSAVKNGKTLSVRYDTGAVGNIKGGFGIYMSRESFLSGTYEVIVTNLALTGTPNNQRNGYQFASVGGGHSYLQTTAGVQLKLEKGLSQGATAASDRNFSGVIIPSDKEIIFMISGIRGQTGNSSIDGLMFIPD